MSSPLENFTDKTTSSPASGQQASLISLPEVVGRDFSLTSQVVVGAILLVGLYLISRINYLLFHTMAELFSIAIGYSIFALTWNSRRYLLNGYLLFIGISKLFTGSIDLLHTLTFKGMDVFPGLGANTATQLWLAARFLGSLSFALAPFFIRRRLHSTRVFIGLSAAAALLLLSIYPLGIFPTAYIDNVGLTPFKIYSEYAIILLLLTALVLLYRQRQAFDRFVFLLLGGSILSSMATELAFTFYIDVYGFFNLVGHFLKIVSFFLIYKAIIETGIVRPYNTIFRELKQSEEALMNTQVWLEEQVRSRTHALEEQRLLLETVLQQAASGIIVRDPDGQLIFANPIARQFFGIQEDEQARLVPSGDLRIYNPDGSLIPRERWLMSLALSGQVIKGREVRLVRKDGGYTDVIASATPLIRKDGSLAGAVLVTADITARRKAEEALRQANQELEARVLSRTADLQEANQRLASELEERKRAEVRMQRLVESNIIGVMFSRENGQITGANDALLAITGYSREDLDSGRLRWTTITPPEYYSSDERGIAEARATGTCEPYEKEYIRKDGSRVPILTGYAALEDSPGEYVCFVIDLSLQKEAEAKIQRYAVQLEQSNHELEEFAYVASHDLQEPLRKIVAFSDRIKSSASDRLTEHELDYLDRMERASERMRNMINGLLVLSRVTTKAQPFEPVDLSQIASEVTADLDVRIEQTGAKVEIEPLPVIEADPLQMRLLLQNLISNALKFTKPGVPPVIQVSTRLDQSNGRHQLHILVTDNGIGFEQRYAERIFLPFQRLNAINVYEGSGMGLAIVSKIVQRHRGSIAARSKPGEGTTFIVTLPLKSGS